MYAQEAETDRKTETDRETDRVSETEIHTETERVHFRLSLAWRLTSRLGYLATQLEGSSCLCFPMQ